MRIFIFVEATARNIPCIAADTATEQYLPFSFENNLLSNLSYKMQFLCFVCHILI